MVNSFVFIVIAVIHCFYSFIIPFIYRIVFIDEDNWTLRFQVTALYGMCMCMCMCMRMCMCMCMCMRMCICMCMCWGGAPKDSGRSVLPTAMPSTAVPPATTASPEGSEGKIYIDNAYR